MEPRSSIPINGSPVGRCCPEVVLCYYNVQCRAFLLCSHHHTSHTTTDGAAMYSYLTYRCYLSMLCWIIIIIKLTPAIRGQKQNHDRQPVKLCNPTGWRRRWCWWCGGLDGMAPEPRVQWPTFDRVGEYNIIIESAAITILQSALLLRRMHFFFHPIHPAGQPISFFVSFFLGCCCLPELDRWNVNVLNIYIFAVSGSGEGIYYL